MKRKLACFELWHNAILLHMNDLKKNLNDKQKEAVEHLEGPLLVIAGAGSGKTRVVTARISHLIQLGVPPELILGLTFTNKAAQEMRERIEQLTHAHVLISTFHSLGARILRESIYLLGFDKYFSIYDEDDSEKLLASCMEKLGIKGKKGDLNTLRKLISKIKNELKSPDEIDIAELPDLFQKNFLSLYHSYEEGLKKSNAVDFDDLLYLPLKLFKEHKACLEHYQRRWKYLSIDEYQDTNLAQYELVNLLAGSERNVFVVGDPDQAIYSWRGANISNILNFERDYPGAKVIRLEQNYRSQSNILDAANALIQFNPTPYKKELWSELGRGALVGRFSGYNERDEARFITMRVKLHKERNQIFYKEMAVFYRTNAQSRPLEDQFLAIGIPYRIVGGISFYQRREIKDLLAFLRLIISDKDIIAFKRVLNIPKRGIGETTQEKIISAAAETDLPILVFCRELLGKKTMSLTTKAREGLASFLQLIDTLRLKAKEPSLTDILRDVIQKTDYIEYLREDRETFEDRRGNVDELIAKAAEWDLSHETAHLEMFLEELSLKTTLDENLEESDDRVNLMTVHNGKGLEFKVAFVAGLEEDLFPHINSREDEKQLQEERRLCYVGMTRAKEYLYLTDSQVRYLFGTQRFQRPSRFLKEIPQSLMERFR